MDTAAESQAWVSSGTDGDWLKARVISQGEDGNAVLEELESKKQHTQPADVRRRARNPDRARQCASPRPRLRASPLTR